MNRFIMTWAVVLSVVPAVHACSDDGTDNKDNHVSAVEVGQTYADIVLASYEDSLADAQSLNTAIEALVADPTETTLQNAKDAWLDSRESYLQTEVYRFYDGPIDNPEDGPEGMINAWPLDEAYIDYVDGDSDAGIINDPTQTIDAETLQEANEQGGEANIATGYHAIEFLLWGQDMNEDGPGNRPHTDFVDGGSAENHDRRGDYLTTVSELLLTHLGSLVDAWKENATYRTEFLSAEGDEILRRILTGMIVLSGFETGGERLQTALDSGDQEDEHSCFSDNTHRDMVQDIQGILNVWIGNYVRIDGSVVSGVGVRQVIGAQNPELTDTLDTQIRQSLDLAKALQPPFDQEIASGNTEGRARVQALIDSLRQQEDLLQEVFTELGLSIPVVE